MRRIAILVAIVATSVVCTALPQVSPDSILKEAENAARYNEDSGGYDSSIVDQLFEETPINQPDHPDRGSPKGIVEDDEFPNCSDYEEDGYYCVPYHRCKDGYILTGGGGQIGIRLGVSVFLDASKNKCPGYSETCCRSRDFEGEDPPTIPPKIIEPKPEPYRQRCGRRNTGGVTARITGITEENGYEKTTQFGEWPHMCAVLSVDQIAGKEVNLFVCGASLISPGVVLTGAHCVFGKTGANFKVRCGEWDTQQNIEEYAHEDIAVKHVTLHPLFNEETLVNDFAVLHLEYDFVLRPHIDTICLPNQDDLEYSYLSDGCFATGWGKDKYGKEGEYQVVLKQVQMDMVDHLECENRLKSTYLTSIFELDKSFVCAGGVPGIDTCKGDGGGPLVCPSIPKVGDRDQRYVQSGIVAWGIDCGTTVPGVYADVSKALCFIDWATKCVEGEHVNHFGYEGCTRWAKREYCEGKENIAKFEYIINTSGVARERGTARRNKRITLSNMEKFKTAYYGCRPAEAEIDCSHRDYGKDGSNINISSHARQGATEEAKTKSTKESSEEETNHSSQEEEETNHSSQEEEPRIASVGQ